MPEEIVGRILRLPGYGVYDWDFDESASTLTVWVRQWGPDPFYTCSGCGVGVRGFHSVRERRVRDLPWGAWKVWLVIEAHRVCCRRCGVCTERIEFLEGKHPYTRRFAEAVARDCEDAAVRRVATKWGLSAQTVRRIDKRALTAWSQRRTRRPLRQMGVDEIFWGKGKCLFDKFHVMKHVNAAVDETRRQEFFRHKGPLRAAMRGKRWLLLTRWQNLTRAKKTELQQALALNRRLFKAYYLKEQLERLWSYTYEGAAARFFIQWLLSLRWQRLPAFKKLAGTLYDHFHGILAYCKHKVPFGVVEAINGNPFQTSNAQGAVGRVHIGPVAILLAAHLKVVGGMSYEKIQVVMEQVLGFKVARSSMCRAVTRLAQRAEPTYQGLIEQIRASPVVCPDETGWKLAGRNVWLWAFTNLKLTIYSVLRGRGYAEAASILGEQYSGILAPDGWAPYQRFKRARLQTCNAHLLRRCREILETATRGAVRFPRAVKKILQHGLTLRDRRDAQQISAHGLRVAHGRLKARVDHLLAGRQTNAVNRRFAKAASGNNICAAAACEAE